ncbi:MAG: recombinase TnpX [Oscillospiraceae bacterium]|nr:recombinase TnpX [Oscillospiraceae bacterium]
MGTKDTYRVGRYARLSREDGDKLESDSIVNQQRVIEDYCAAHAGLVIVEDYADAADIIGLNQNPTL